MKINALLDVNVVAHETEDEVAVLLEIEAPAAALDASRPQASLQVVLDRSGSMSGDPLEGSKKVITDLVRRLEPTDNFGLVTFDDAAQIVVPAGPLVDKAAVEAAIAQIEPGGTTDLSAGYLRGLREIRRVLGDAGGTVLIISDGHVNAGINGADEFASITAKAYSERIVTSTLGYGRHYDETLLSAISRSGSGNHVFADNPDAAGVAIAGEVDGLLNKVVLAASLGINFEPTVEFARLFNDLPSMQIGDGKVLVELGDLYASEARKVLLKFKVPAMASLGLAQIATLELAYVELPGLVEQTVTLPITVNVVPGDEAAGRIPHPSVQSEVLFQEAQDVKREASEAFERGEFALGQRLIGETRVRLARSLAAAPESLKPEIRAEVEEVTLLEARSVALGVEGAGYLSKQSRESYHRGSRKRGR